MKNALSLKFLFLILASITLIFSGVHSAFSEGTEVATNSLSWQDVYSGGIYAALNEYEYGYVIEKTQSFEVIQTIDNDVTEMVIINPTSNNHISAFKSSVEDRDVEVVQEFTSNDYIENNLAIAEYSGVDRFVLVDDTYGYNAISVGPYAVKSGAFVVFVNDENVDDVIDLVDGAQDVLVYGPIDRDAREQLEPYTTETIDLKSKYANNLAILEKIKEIEPLVQVVMTNGAVLEHEIMDGFKPVLFIGTSNVPEGVIELVQDERIEVGILIGDGIATNGRTIREQTGIQIFVKFAKGINEIQKALDIVFVDVYDLNLTFNGISYNPETNELILSVENLNDNFIYGTFSIQILKDGEVIGTVGSEGVEFISGEEILTQIYDLNLDDPEAEYTVNIVSQYGEDESSLEKLLEVEDQPLQFIVSEDPSEINIESVTYNQDTKRFEIKIKNTGEDTAYFRAKIAGFIIDGEETDLASSTYQVLPGKTVTAKIRADLQAIDFEDNDIVSLTVLFGQDKDKLIKIIQGDFDFTISTAVDYLLIVAVALAVVLIALVGFLIFFGKRFKLRRY